jgi:hypothetical protein
MEKRLVSDEFKLRRSGEDWLDAWNLSDEPSKKAPADAPRKKAA